MDGWRKAYTHFGFDDLDLKFERLLIYGTTAIFWTNLVIWLLTQDGGLIFGANNLRSSVRTPNAPSERHS